MRLLHAFFIALFIFAAVLQYNDPDPIRWMAIYLAGAVACTIAVMQRPMARPAAIIIGAVALVWALTYLPSVLRHGQVLSMFDEWEMRNQEVLENREMFGLLIVAGVMASVVWSARRWRNRAER